MVHGAGGMSGASARYLQEDIFFVLFFVMAFLTQVKRLLAWFIRNACQKYK